MPETAMGQGVETLMVYHYPLCRTQEPCTLGLGHVGVLVLI